VATHRADATVRDLYGRLLDAWNRRNADDYAAPFAADSTLIGFDGSVVIGSADICDHLAPIFADHPTAGYVSKIREVRPLGPQTTLFRAIVGMVPPGGTDLNPAVNARQVLVTEQHTAELRRLLPGPATGS